MLIAAGRIALWVVALAAQGSNFESGAAHLRATDDRPHIRANDNRRPAGRLEGGRLILHLEAREGAWYPDGPDGEARPVAAFAEEGGTLLNPGPLIRVPAGTEVRVTVKNSLAAPLTMFGLGEQRGIGADSTLIAPGTAREMRFTATTPGTYYYAGKTMAGVPRLFARRGHDSQLNGVIVVDPPGAAAGGAGDRIFVISWWGSEDEIDGVMAINGLSWPSTERFEVGQGDSLHWRWVNMTQPGHPMHLHGFYFRVDAKGDGARYAVYTPEQRRLAVTELLRAGETMAIAWSPDRPGNWIFHCHVALHMTPGRTRQRSETTVAAAAGVSPMAHGSGHRHAMAKLVLGIRVNPRGPVARSSVTPRALRLLVRSRTPADGGNARFGYVLGGSADDAGARALSAPGPTLVLRKGEPVAINVVNQSHEPAAVHWHGIELESYSDGVPGWSGIGNDVFPAIAPGDSLTVHFTPPRAGTFMYHSHFNELQQIASGLYGAIVVLEPGRRYDAELDRLLILSDSAPMPDPTRGLLPTVLLNGQARPEPLRFRAGVTYRLRLLNIRSNLPATVALLDGDRPVEWRHVAKDGADLPPAQAITRPAQLALGPGEIYDFEFTATRPGGLRLVLGFPPGFRPPPAIQVPPPKSVAVWVGE